MRDEYNKIKILYNELLERSNLPYYTYKPMSIVMYDFHTSGKKIRIIRGGVRSGKTTACIWDVVAVALKEHKIYNNPACKYCPKTNTYDIWVVGQKLSKAQELYKKYEAIIPPKKIKSTSTRSGFLHITLTNGNTIYFKAQNQREGEFESTTAYMIHVDERILEDEKNKNKDLVAKLKNRIISHNGLMVFTMDGNGVDSWLGDLLLNNSAIEYNIDTSNNVFLSKEQIDEIKEEYSEEEYNKYYLGAHINNQNLFITPDMFNIINYKEIKPARYNVVNGQFLYDERGSLRVFVEKKENLKYIMGVDIAEGNGGNATVIQIFDRRGEQIAEYIDNTVQLFEMNKIIYDIAIYYNNATINIEKNNIGAGTISYLTKGMKYFNIMSEINVDINKIGTYKAGLNTTNTNKADMSMKLYNMITNNEIIIHSSYLHYNILNFKCERKRMTNGSEKTYFKGDKMDSKAKVLSFIYDKTDIKELNMLRKSDDDLTMATLFVIYALKTKGLYIDKPQEIKVNTYNNSPYYRKEKKHYEENYNNVFCL
jgi:hypothetical protein